MWFNPGPIFDGKYENGIFFSLNYFGPDKSGRSPDLPCPK